MKIYVVDYVGLSLEELVKNMEFYENDEKTNGDAVAFNKEEAELYLQRNQKYEENMVHWSRHGDTPYKPKEYKIYELDIQLSK